MNLHMKDDSELSVALYQVAREKATEPAFQGKYWNTHDKGTYVCAVCGAPLFSSNTKYDSGTGWPSFTKPIDDAAIATQEDTSDGTVRNEVVCTGCDAHLGHVFDDGPEEQGGKRYCINSVSLELT